MEVTAVNELEGMINGLLSNPEEMKELLSSDDYKQLIGA